MIVFEAIADCCASRLLGNLSEHTLKGVALEALLREGCAVMEGTTRAGMGKVLRLVRNRIELEYVERAPQKSVVDPERGASPDIRVWEPCEFVLELQARSEFGSQDGASTTPVLDDLARVCGEGADAFVLAADRSIYDSMRGIKSSTAGRPLAAPGVLAAIFPESAVLESDGDADRDGNYQGTAVWTFARMVTAPSGVQRVIVAVRQTRAELIDKH
ncbi:MAG: hypothetical protein U0164_20815 [Gemmatimonadaceae bacterium]